MHTDLLPHSTGSGRRKLRLFALYTDISAAACVRKLTRELGHRPGKSVAFSTELWKLDSVTPPSPIKEMIAQEAADADLLVIASGASDPPDPALAAWLETLAERKLASRPGGLVIGLFAAGESEAEPSDSALESLENFARRAGMEFVWRRTRPDVFDDADWLSQSLERYWAGAGQPASAAES